MPKKECAMGTLEPWEIEEIEKQKKKREENDRPQPSVEIEIPTDNPDEETDKNKKSPDRGVIIIPISPPNDNEVPV